MALLLSSFTIRLASIVVPIDKLSIVVTIIFSYVVFHERLNKKLFIGLMIMIVGTLLMLFKYDFSYIFLFKRFISFKINKGEKNAKTINTMVSTK